MINDLVISQIRQRLEILYQMVDELEAGGGGGGTTNYNDLSNKPSINNQVLTGNKTLSELGAATPSDITQAFAPSTIELEEGGTFPSGSRSLLTEHKPLNVNDDQYYFLEETGVDYLYGSMPTSGAYPSLSYLRIMKSSFAVEFHNTEIDTVPTENSDNLITSGAVYDAVQGSGGNVTPTYFGTSIPGTLTDEQYAVIQNRLPISTGTTEATATNIFQFLGEDSSAYWYGYTTGASDTRYIYQTICRIAKSGKTTYTWPQAILYTDQSAAARISSANGAIQISSNSNLDNRPTGYAFASAAVAATLTNCPTTEAFKIFTDDVAYGSTYLIQRLYTCAATPAVYIRAKVNGTWGSWYKFEGTLVS